MASKNRHILGILLFVSILVTMLPNPREPPQVLKEGVVTEGLTPPKASALQEYDWHYIWDGGREDWAEDCCVDGDGNIYFVGTKNQSSNDADVWVFKYAPNGSLIWEDTWDTGHDYQRATALTCNSTHILITGMSWATTTNPNVFILCYNKTGTLNWSRVYPTTTDREYAGGIAFSPLGDIFITGSVAQDPFYQDRILLGRMNPAGTGEEFYIGPNTSEWGNDMVVSDSSIFIAGYSSGSFALWEISYDPADPGVLPQIQWEQKPRTGNYEATSLWMDGTVLYVTGGNYGVCYTVAYSTEGTKLWESEWSGSSGSSDPRGEGIWSDEHNNVYVTGSVKDNLGDIFVLKLHAGTQKWVVPYDTGGLDNAFGITGQENGSLYIAGLVDGDILVLNFDDNDLDDDSLSNTAEELWGTGIYNPDSDGDGLTDGYEVSHNYKPLDTDSDDDTLLDGEEVSLGTSPIKVDTDGDGMSDPYEIAEGFAPTDGTDGAKDADADGLTNAQEFLRGTDPRDTDTDNDGLTDFQEVDTYGTNPLLADTDGDGMPDAWEAFWGTNPLVADQSGDPDSDGLTNAVEYEHQTNPLANDTDGDGLNDAEEIQEYGTDPSKADTDGDGLTDAAEIQEYHTNPSKADTDGDGTNDGDEVDAGTDPTDKWSSPTIRGGWRTFGIIALICGIVAGALFGILKTAKPLRQKLAMSRARKSDRIAREREERLDAQQEAKKREQFQTAWRLLASKIPPDMPGISEVITQETPQDLASAKHPLEAIISLVVDATKQRGDSHVVGIYEALSEFATTVGATDLKKVTQRYIAGLHLRKQDWGTAEKFYSRGGYTHLETACRGLREKKPLDFSKLLDNASREVPGEDILVEIARFGTKIQKNSVWIVNFEEENPSEVDFTLSINPSGTPENVNDARKPENFTIHTLELPEGLPLYRVEFRGALPAEYTGGVGPKFTYAAHLQVMTGTDPHEKYKPTHATVTMADLGDMPLVVSLPAPDFSKPIKKIKQTLKRPELEATKTSGGQHSRWAGMGNYARFENHARRRQQFMESLYKTEEKIEVLGVILVDEKNATLGIVNSAGVEEMSVTTLNSGLAGKHHAGGWSQARFERLHEEAVQVFLERVARRANQAFMQNEVDHIIMGGNTFRAQELADSNLLDYRLREKLADEPVPVQYHGAPGIRELLQRLEAYLVDLECVRLQGLFSLFLEGVALGLSEVSYGIEEVRSVLKEGRVEILLVGEDLDPKVVGELRVIAAQYSTRVEEVPASTEWGWQLHSTFGGIAALLRY